MDKPRQLPAFLFPGARAEEETCWHPSVDVYRIERGWLLKFDLAGVRVEDVTVQVQGGRITVSGVRRDWALERDARHYQMEIAYNRFERTVELPCQFDNPRVILEGRDGILIVRVMAEQEGL